MFERLRSGRKLEWATLVVFVVAYCTITSFHEPWFDEAQAWQIAKCGSIQDILFEIPHYEGHPPLWHLILAIPAKLGVPFELGLKAVGFVFSTASIALILFKMPYPRFIRLLLPFSYFVFYQYGIIVRPYCAMLLLFLLLALAFPSKDEKPWRFTILLMLLCLTGAYGMVVAAGVALCWTWDLVRSKGIAGFLKGVLCDKRTLSLISLLVLAIAIVLEIMPREDTLVTSSVRLNPFAVCLICALFTFLPECTIMKSTWFSADRYLLQSVPIPFGELLTCCIVGIILWILVASVGTKRNVKYLIVPYVLFALFATMVYAISHHIGIALLIVLFWLGIAFQDNDRFELGRLVMAKLAHTQRDRKMARGAAIIFSSACLAVPIYWSVAASISDIQVDYSYGRSAERFLRETGLGAVRIMAGGDAALSVFRPDSADSDNYLNTCTVSTPVLINAYFGRNICENLNGGSDDEAYVHHRVPSREQSRADLIEWASEGLPDVLLGKNGLEKAFGDEALNDYVPVYVLETNYAWKDSVSHGRTPVYLRSDLLETYGLERLNDPKYALAVGLVVTDEMQEAYENGASLDEIIDPVLDQVFGDN